MQYLKSKTVIYLVVTLGLDAVFFSMTNPGQVAAPWLIVGYLLAVATLYWLVRGFVAFLGLYSKAVRRQKRRIAKLLAIVGAALLAMQSIGQLSVRDMAVLVPLGMVGYFYMTYGRKKEQSR